MAAFKAENIIKNPFTGKLNQLTLDNITLDTFFTALDAEGLIDYYSEMMEAFRYNGFNPINFFAVLVQMAKTKGISRDVFLKDMLDLISYYASRGTTIQARGVKDSLHDEIKARITELIGRYEVKDNIPTVGAKADVVTMGRIQATFPLILGGLYASGRAKPIGSPGIIPPGLMFPGGAALIPADSKYDDILKLFVNWSVTFTKVISRRNKAVAGKSDKEIWDDQESWANIARGSPAVPEKTRVVFLATKCNISQR